MQKNVVIGFLVLSIAFLLISGRARETGVAKAEGHDLQNEGPRESDRIIDGFKKKNAQLAEENQRLLSELSKVKSEREDSEKSDSHLHTPREQTTDKHDFEGDPATNTERYYIDDNGENIALYDPSGKALFEYSTVENKLLYKDGVHLDELGVVIFDKASLLGDLKSSDSKEKASLIFENTLSESAYVYWIDYQGQPKYYRTLEPGEKYAAEHLFVCKFVQAG